jgi:hypothetical protein
LSPDSPEFKKHLNEKIVEQETFRSRMALLLLSGKCNPNATNNQSETPLFYAIENGNTSFARFMLTNRLIQSQITAKESSAGKTLLALMAEKCSEIDACSVVFFTDQSNDYSLFDKFRAQFEEMAKHKDNSELTPFQVAAQKIRAQLPNVEKLPESVIKFMLFLYRDCKSDPNDLIYEGKHQIESKQDDTEDEDGSTKTECDDNQQMEVDSDGLDASKNQNSNRKFHSPLANLVSNKCIELLEKLVNLMHNNKSNQGLIKINLNAHDSDGLTPLLKSLILGETKFAIKLAELDFMLNPEQFALNISSQVCQKRISNVHLGENLLQLSLRHKYQISFIHRVVDLMSNVINGNNLTSLPLFAKLISHENCYKQNFLHVLASLVQNSDNLLNLMNLGELVTRLGRILALDSSYSGLLCRLVSAQDKLGRTPLHLCLLNSGRRLGSNNSNIDLEIFFLEKIFGLIFTNRYS